MDAGDRSFQVFAVHVAFVGVFWRAFGVFVAFEQAEEVVVFDFVFVVIDAGAAAAAAFAGRAAAAVHTAHARFAKISERDDGDAVGAAEAADVAMHPGEATFKPVARPSATIVVGANTDSEAMSCRTGRPLRGSITCDCIAPLSSTKKLR